MTDLPGATGLAVLAWSDGVSHAREDALAVEEPLEIRLAGCRVTVTMRTPGDDFDLAIGFLFTEGIIRGLDDIVSIASCPDESGERDDGALLAGHSNIVNVNPHDPAIVAPERWQRNFFAASSCGICGKASIAAIRQDAPPLVSDMRVSAGYLSRLDAEMRRGQQLFGRTGGLHAAALFDREGRLVTLREDVGRHNAVDKVIGDALRRGRLPLSGHVLMVSGRASFEIVQKALMAGIPIVAAVSAPSSLAVALAREANLTLAGFLRGGRFNVYAGAQRVVAND